MRSNCSLSLVFGSWIGAGSTAGLVVAVLAPVLLAESAGRVAVTARGWQP